MQAQLLRAARRGHERSLEAAQSGTEWSQVLGKGHQLTEGSREGTASVEQSRREDWQWENG